MEDQNNNIDNLFKKGLGNYTESPPPQVWDALEKRLDGKQKKRGFFYPWFISLLLLSFLSLLGGTFWKLAMHEPAATKSATANEIAANTNTSSVPNTITDNKTADNTNNTADNTTDNINKPTEKTNKASKQTNSDKASNGQTDKANMAAKDGTTIKNDTKLPNETSTKPGNTVEQKTVATEESKQDGTSVKAFTAPVAAAKILPAGNINTLNALPDVKALAKTKEGNTVTPTTQGTIAGENPVIETAAKREHIALSEIDAAHRPIAKNNSIAKPLAKEVKIENTIAPIIPAASAEPVSTFKESIAAGADTANKKNDIDNKPENSLPKEAISKIIADRLEAGVKGGYEGGFGTNAAQKLVGSFYLQYKLSPKFALMAQPTAKIAHLTSQTINGKQTFYNEHNDSNSTVTPIAAVYITTQEGNQDTIGYNQKYTFSQTHDSIVKSYAYGGTTVELELPILLKYSISDKLSVYGGINIIYDRTYGIKEQTYTAKNIAVTADTTVQWAPLQPSPAAPSASSVLKYTGTTSSNYAGPLYPTQSNNLLRFGYMLGFSYEFRKRWLFDALMQQGSAKSNVQGAYDINKPLALPYFRVTLGYKLGKLFGHLK